MPEQKTSFWSTIPGLLTGLAALIAALTGVYQVVATKPSVTTSSPAVSSAHSDTDHTAGKPTVAQHQFELQKLTGLLVHARETGNVDYLMKISGVPFLFNGQIVHDSSDLRQKFQEWATASGRSSPQDLDALWTKIKNESDVITVAQLKAKFGEKAADALAGSGIGDEDLCLELKGSYHYFYRPGQGGSKCIGFLK